MKTIIVILGLMIVLLGSACVYADPIFDCWSDCPGSVSPSDAVVLMCPQGDTPPLSERGATISLPFMARVPEGSIYPINACSNLAFCFPPQIDGPLDANGIATFSGNVAGGGQTTEWLWASGWIPEPPCLIVEVPVRIVSPDINADVIVNLQGFSLFGRAYPPQPYDFRADFNGDMVINLIDFAIFVLHYRHHCE